MAKPAADIRLAVVVMGVSGCGKSTVGEALAGRLGLPFQDGDALHTPACKAKMHAGIPLDDQDRAPWLDRIAALLADAAHWPAGGVVACSALRRRYRDRLRAGAPGVRFLYLDGTAALIQARLAQRQHEYMPASLLDSQFAALERPAADERDTLTHSIAPPVAAIVETAAAWLTGPDASAR